ncbi:MAG: hypothetical protein D6767_10415 [Candidatus Hydrogenedentota bacterium]|nr:MAG: hypothetical protein D6767_10415 [Candidatus Hydrogenedentota bacterium]
MKSWFIVIIFFVSLRIVFAHHFKGLPHYGYFENYPQTPVDEFLGGSKHYDFFLTLYDFQGLEKEKADQPDDVKFFLNVYDLVHEKAYNGPLFVEILDHGKPIDSVVFYSAEQESLYYYNHKLSDDGDYALRISIIDLQIPEEDKKLITGEEVLKNNNLPVMNRVPDVVLKKSKIQIKESGILEFVLDSQKIHWGRWLLLALAIVIVIVIAGARRKRVLEDRKMGHKE